jgi:hypothetical protein
MNYRTIENYLNSPLKIYDGCEAHKILYKVKNKEGKIVCKIDLWNAYENDCLRIDKESELDEINSVLGLPKKKSFTTGKRVIMTDKLDGEDTLVDFTRCGKDFEYIIAYTLFEKQPSRYQCYVLAVLQRKE